MRGTLYWGIKAHNMIVKRFDIDDIIRGNLNTEVFEVVNPHKCHLCKKQFANDDTVVMRQCDNETYCLMHESCYNDNTKRNNVIENQISVFDVYHELMSFVKQ